MLTVKLAAIVAAFLLAEPWLPQTTAQRYGADVLAATSQCEAALMLVATADGESSLRGDVERCEVTGKHGEVGLYQLRPKYLGARTTDAVCHDNRLATRLAHWRLARLRAEKPSAQAALVGYIGASSMAAQLAEKRVALYERLRREIPCE
jgi:hypothetical protein